MILACTLLMAVSQPEVRKVEKLFAQYQFDQARKKAHKLREAGIELSADERDSLLRIEAFSSFYLDDRPAAETALRRLFADVPNAPIDASQYPPELVDFFERIKARVAAEHQPTQVAPQVAASVPVQPPPPQPRFNPLSLIPFGIGQMAQRDYLAGALWLTLDALLLAGNITTHYLFHQLLNADGTFSNPQRATTLQLTEDILGFALIASVVAGVIDSVFGSPRRVQPTVHVGVAPAPHGATLSLGFGF
jgi:hypothetical protein